RMTVTTLTPAERQVFKEAVQPAAIKAIRQSLGDDGDDLLSEFLAAAKAHSR
ncbi:MAG: C4-dicarboxylate ABC transporter substrate-binding protein, partial [Magnetospirillum sp.]|nr:C4-dicarboxylate ABC transporter substrate-binding protein [Magnetospirillum sp.]